MSTTGKTTLNVPGLTEALRQTPVRIEQQLTDVDAIDFGQSASGWSACDHMRHLARLETLWSERLDDLLNGRTPLRQLDPEEPTQREVNDKQSLLEHFTTMRAALIALLGSLTDDDLQKSAEHPWARRQVDVADLLEMIRESDETMLRRIENATG